MKQENTTNTYPPISPHLRKRFAVVMTGVFVVIGGTLGYLDLLPESPEVQADDAVQERSMPVLLAPYDIHGTDSSPVVSVSSEEVEAPAVLAITKDTSVRRVVINAIGLNATVSTPPSTDLAVLDNALLKGAVRYPDSAQLGDVGNMLIFGHSSSLPVIHNQNFRIFNRLHELEAGDVVRVQSTTHEYVYRVESVRMAKAEDVMVRFDTREKRLTMVTCNNSFGDTSDRYLVEAAFITQRELQQ